MGESNVYRSVLGKDFHITGELTINEDAVIEGQVDGVLRGGGLLELSETGRVSGTIIAASIRIAGQVQADVVGEEDVEVLPGGKMRGRVFSHRFCVNDGAGFRGEIWVDADAMQAAKQHVISQLGNQAGAAPAPGNPAPGTPGNGAKPAGNMDVTSAELAILTNNNDTLNNTAHGRPLRIRGANGMNSTGNGGNR